MTTKRFELKWRDTGEVLYDNETGLEHGIYSPDYRFHVRDMMNELAEEKEILEVQLKSATNEIDKLDSEINMLTSTCHDCCKEIREENEQLKNKIDVLEDDNETYHKSLEQLNLYTKRFIPTKCTNEFKDCKTNRYYWLDHEGNFKGCLELLNLLDCENEVLKSENRQLKGRLMEYEEQIKGDLND